VTPDYFRALRIPLIKGRFFEDRDSQSAPPVAIISKSLAQRLVPNAKPIGKRMNVEGVKGVVEVVGVVGDVHQLGITSEMTSEIYLPFSQVAAPIICFAIRTTEDPLSLVKAAESAIWAVDKDQAVGFVMSMSQLASDSLAPQRVIVLILGAVGIYGVLANSVAQRTHEIGVRMALGARSGDVLKLVVGQGFGLVLVGVAIGLAGAFGLMRFVSSLLYGIRPTDPVTLVVAAFVLAAAALLASYIPARRAMRVDPMVALRYE